MRTMAACEKILPRNTLVLRKSHGVFFVGYLFTQPDTCTVRMIFFVKQTKDSHDQEDATLQHLSIIQTSETNMWKHNNALQHGS